MGSVVGLQTPGPHKPSNSHFPEIQIMAMGPNMQKLLAAAQGNKNWTPVGKDRADKRAVESLTKQGLLAVREHEGVQQYILKEFADQAKAKADKPKREPKVKEPKVRKVSNFQKAVNYCIEKGDVTRQDLIKWLREELKLSEAGANTYSSAAMKAAKAANANPSA